MSSNPRTKPADNRRVPIYRSTLEIGLTLSWSKNAGSLVGWWHRACSWSFMADMNWIHACGVSSEDISFDSSFRASSKASLHESRPMGDTSAWASWSSNSTECAHVATMDRGPPSWDRMWSHTSAQGIVVSTTSNVALCNFLDVDYGCSWGE